MTVLGRDVDTGGLISLEEDARARGVYVIGSTGTGKTTLLQSIAFQDMKAGDGLCVLDPHGDMIDWLLERIPSERVDDVIVFDPSETEHPFGLNLLECDIDDPHEVRWVVSTITATLRRLFYYSWGPRLEHVLRHTLQTALTQRGATFLELLLLLLNEEYRENFVNNLADPVLKTFWDTFPRSERLRYDLVSSTLNKISPFITDHSMRNIIGQAHSTFDIRHVMDERKILLVNLSKGDLGEENFSLLGSVLINSILIAALKRRDMSLQARQEAPFHVIVDEYQNFATESFVILQSEARKYAVDLVVAHQFRDQLALEIRGSALNVGNFVCFRVTGVDGPELAAQFDNTPPPPDPIWEVVREHSPQWPGVYERGAVDRQVPGPQRLYSDVLMQTANDLANLVPFRARARTIEKDQNQNRLKLGDYTLDLLNPYDDKDDDLIIETFGVADKATAERIRRNSLQLGESRGKVEAEINRRTGGATRSPAQTAQRISDS